MLRNLLFPVLIVVSTFLFSESALGDIVNFNTWTLVEDPAHPGFSSNVDSPSQITLNATGGPIPNGTDIGYASVNGSTPESSTSGHFFDPLFDFSVAVDFEMNFANPVGTLAFGFGIGEDQAGANSAGVVLVTNDGGAIGFVGGARVNDSDLPPSVIAILPQLAARLIVEYDATSGDVVVGVSTNGDDSPEGIATFSGIQNDWNDGLLFASFFIRSDNRLGSPWSSGNSDTVVSNFHVISGSATSIPEPSSLALLTGVFALAVSIRRLR